MLVIALIMAFILVRAESQKSGALRAEIVKGMGRAGTRLKVVAHR